MAKTITEKEEFGKINEIEVRFANGAYPDLNKCGWGLPANSPTCQFLIGQAVHIFDLTRFFCGDVEEIYAVLNKGKSFDDGSATFGYAVALTFKNGSIGIMNLSAFHCPNFQMSEYFLAAGDECWLEVRDMLELNYHANHKPMPEFNPNGRAQIFSWRPEFTEVGASTAGGITGYEGEMRNFARASIGLEKPVADLFDGAKALQIAEAIWESSQSRKAVKIKKLL
jgi:predicted dehydrogenase